MATWLHALVGTTYWEAIPAARLPRGLILDELGYLPLTLEEARLLPAVIRLGRGLQRPDPGDGHPRPVAAPRHHRQPYLDVHN
jgi:hypothetical protein